MCFSVPTEGVKIEKGKECRRRRSGFVASSIIYMAKQVKTGRMKSPSMKKNHGVSKPAFWWDNISGLMIYYGYESGQQMYTSDSYTVSRFWRLHISPQRNLAQHDLIPFFSYIYMKTYISYSSFSPACCGCFQHQIKTMAVSGPYTMARHFTLELLTPLIMFISRLLITSHPVLHMFV